MVGLLAMAMGVQNVTIEGVGGLNVYTTFQHWFIVLFGEAASQYIFWLIAQCRRGADDGSRVRILPANNVSPYGANGGIVGDLPGGPRPPEYLRLASYNDVCWCP
jgi:hypothetical protein